MRPSRDEWLMSVPKLDPQLSERLQANPAAPLRLIIRLSGDLDAHAAEVAARGLVVYRRLALIDALAVVATGDQALALSAEPWVLRIEEDRQVRSNIV